MAAAPNVSDAELVEARERTDAGVRLAMPWLFDGLGGSVEPDPIPSEDLEEFGELVGEAREKLIRAMAVMDRNRGKEDASDVHMQVGEIVLDVDEVLRPVMERCS